MAPFNSQQEQQKQQLMQPLVWNCFPNAILLDAFKKNKERKKKKKKQKQGSEVMIDLD